MKNPSGLCLCGCDQKTNPSPTSRRGYKRGDPLRFVKGHSSRKAGPDYQEEDRGFVTPCWIWCKSTGSQGYGRIWVNDVKAHLMAHRVYYERAKGRLWAEWDLHHLCRNRACVNPDHLQPLTRREHMIEDGRRPFGNKRAVVHA